MSTDDRSQSTNSYGTDLFSLEYSSLSTRTRRVNTLALGRKTQVQQHTVSNGSGYKGVAVLLAGFAILW